VTRSLVWSDEARRDLRAIDRTVARRVVDVVERYAETGHGDVQRMQGTKGQYRLRVGDYRVIFELDEATLLVKRIAHRREVYRS